ncbi:branched-chain amino acid transport system substrate-binding protein [Enhydrobacter aerosaccus]|uniref:Branched-chain amino acid transport system substrate-binding protein n=1 Tax=Enhydrobacter aerosaccus TaxID=225324 RepID=A0A1T4N4U3_9HYPH|nr:ABC transporter substrate-binding protein [Enhydrobacter aerosaccus]SJZ73888.1 branched-chain amino acid transport system substrate-binding protein [Enhydrobacter aerosaccus]
MKVANVARLMGAVTAGVCLVALGVATMAQAQAPQPLKIGLMAGLSGVYADVAQGQVEAMQLAIEDVGGKVLGRPIEIVSADHQNKPDVAAGLARKWYDDGVKMITGLDTSSVGLAVRKVAQEKGQIDLNVGSATADLTGPACSATGAHWVYDTYALAHVTGSAVVKDGGDTWFFITADYAFGKSMEDETAAVVKGAGGKVVGGVKHPLSTQDFSSYLLQAQGSKAKVIGLANAGMDTVNAIKQANEFGIVKGGQRIAALLIFDSDVQSLGLPVAQGLVLTTPFYWDMNDETRAWTKRFRAKKDKLPNLTIAGVYSATLHYLKAVQAAGTDEPMAVMAKMREMPINDMMTKNGKLREDGRVIRDMYLAQVKSPAESKSKDDIYKILATVPADQAWRPLKDGHCPLIKN